MPANFTGTESPTPGAIAPCPAPAPGVAPVIAVPVDTDPNTVAAMFAQQYPALADFAAYAQKASRVSLPLTPGGSGVDFGFGAVSHVGAGTGTITPSGNSISGYFCVVKIANSGGLGVGTFQFSTDGGATYGVAQTIPGGGTYTDASSVKVTFAGTFNAGDTYAFRSADPPRQMWTDPAGRARELIDHMGYPLGQISAHREDWSHGLSGTITTGSAVFPGYSKWSYSSAYADTWTLRSPQSDLKGCFNSMLFTGEVTAASAVSFLESTQVNLITGTTSPTSFVMQQLVRIEVDTAQIALIGVGLVQNYSSSHPFKAVFERTPGGNWFAVVKDDLTTVLNVDTGVAPQIGATANWQLLRIEYYGPSTTIGTALGGGVWRFLIDGVQVGIAVYSALAMSAKIHMRVNDLGNATVSKVGFGPVAWALNWLGDPTRM